MRANAGCSTEYVCDGGGRGPCEKVAKTVREVQCLHVGGSGGVGSSGAGGVVVVAVVVAAVWRCWCYFGVYARVYWWDTHFGGAVVLALSPVTSHSLFLSNPSIHRDYPLCRPHGGHRTESDRARPGTTQDGCVSLTRGRQTRRGKDNPEINGTCCYVIVGPVPEQRDTGQEARGTFSFSITLHCRWLASFSFLRSFFLTRRSRVFPSLSLRSVKWHISKFFRTILWLTGCRRYHDSCIVFASFSFETFITSSIVLHTCISHEHTFDTRKI